MTGTTVEQFRTLVKVMKAVYAQPSFIADDDAFKTWYVMLCDIPYDSLQKGIQLHLQTQKFPPTIADLRVAASQFAIQDETFTDLEAWAIVRTALCRSGYYWQEEFEKLPELVQKAVGNSYNLREWSQMDTATVESVIQSQFLRSFRTIKAQRVELNKLSPALREKIERADGQKGQLCENQSQRSQKIIGADTATDNRDNLGKRWQSGKIR